MLDERAPFSESVVWAMQRRYFTESGIAPWRDDEVPQYVTTNAFIADAYAEIVLAFLADRSARGAPEEPLHVCDLGAGSGRFAYHFLTRFTDRCRKANRPVQIRYVLTDFADGNLAFWLEHPAFAPFFRAGLLDVAPFDLMSTDRLELRLSGRTIAPQALREPLVVIANYVFDGVPQELLYARSGRLDRCELTLSLDADPPGVGTADLLSRVRCAFEHGPVTTAPFGDAFLDGLCDDYRVSADGFFFVPAAAVRSLRRLKALSRSGMLVLSADRGSHRLGDIVRPTPPVPTRHGSLSFDVNYHALAAACEQSGGLALFPELPHREIDAGALLFVGDAAGHHATAAAYDERVRAFGPDDFANVVHSIGEHAGTMAFDAIHALLRLSRHDSLLLGMCLPRLRELAPELAPAQTEVLLDAFDRTWDGYFPLGEPFDLAFAIAGVLFDLGEYERALTYLQRSAELYGESPGTLYNIAVCRQLLGDGGAALRALRDALGEDDQ